MFRGNDVTPTLDALLELRIALTLLPYLTTLSLCDASFADFTTDDGGNVFRNIFPIHDATGEGANIFSHEDSRKVVDYTYNLTYRAEGYTVFKTYFLKRV
jgi:hypothetical protein